MPQGTVSGDIGLASVDKDLGQIIALGVGFVLFVALVVALLVWTGAVDVSFDGPGV
jgi:hypothetical protein